MIQLCGWDVPKREVFLYASVKEIDIIRVNEVSAIHKADLGEDFALQKEGASRRISYSLWRVELPFVVLLEPPMISIKKAARKEFPASAPDQIDLVMVIDLCCSHVTVELPDSIVQTFHKILRELRVIIEQKDRFAVIQQGSSDAIVIAFRHSEIVGVRDYS